MQSTKVFLILALAVFLIFSQSQSYAFNVFDEIHNAGDALLGPSHRQQEAARREAEAATKALEQQKADAAAKLAAQQAEDSRKLASEQAKAVKILKKQEASTALVLAEQKAKFQMELEASKAKHELAKKQQELDFAQQEAEMNLKVQREYITSLEKISEKEQAANQELQTEIAGLNRKHNFITALISAISVVVGAFIPLIFNRKKRYSIRKQDFSQELQKEE